MIAASQSDGLLRLIRSTANPLVPNALVLERLLAELLVVNVQKGGTVLRMGEVAETLFFIEQGFVRFYYADPDTGDERTGQFFDEGGVVSDAASFLMGKPATQTIEAIEDSVLIAIPKQALLRAYDEDHAIERFGRKIVEGGFIGSQRRTANLLNMTPDQRYRHYVETRPEIVRRVPQFMLANFLGITPESLSRIRGRIARAAKEKRQK